MFLYAHSGRTYFDGHAYYKASLTCPNCSSSIDLYIKKLVTVARVEDIPHLRCPTCKSPYRSKSQRQAEE